MIEIPSYAYLHPVVVQPGDIDTMNHVNNVVYTRWIQEASEAHWVAKMSVELRSEMGWVVRRHEIDYLRPCQMVDELMAYTWPDKAEGTKVNRFVLIKNLKTGKEIMFSKTTWVLLNMQTLRPMPYPAELESVFIPLN